MLVVAVVVVGEDERAGAHDRAPGMRELERAPGAGDVADGLAVDLLDRVAELGGRSASARAGSRASALRHR